MYDIIIIGAGPTGCTAGKILAENGFNTLIVEKFKMPRYKSCSGQLIERSINLISQIFNEKIPDNVTCKPRENLGMIFTNDKGKEFRFEQNGLNIWRSSFDSWLSEKAAQYGAEIRDDTLAIDCIQNKDFVTVTLKNNNSIYKEKAKYVINCEGVAGTIKRKVLGCEFPYIITFQTYNQGCIDLDSHYFYAYLQPELSEYDAWFNVKDNKLVLGVAVKNNAKIKFYYSRFISYMKKMHNLKIECQLQTDKWLMPHILPGCKINYGKERIFFAGETAGFLNPMGEGISIGIESAYCIANAIKNNFDDTDKIHDDYILKAESLQIHMKRQWNLVARLTDTFNDMRLL